METKSEEGSLHYATYQRAVYIIDENGQRVSVVLEISAYQKLLEELEELESIRAYDQAKSRDDETIPFEQAVEDCRFG